MDVLLKQSTIIRQHIIVLSPIPGQKLEPLGRAVNLAQGKDKVSYDHPLARIATRASRISLIFRASNTEDMGIIRDMGRVSVSTKKTQ